MKKLNSEKHHYTLMKINKIYLECWFTTRSDKKYKTSSFQRFFEFCYEAKVFQIMFHLVSKLSNFNYIYLIFDLLKWLHDNSNSDNSKSYEDSYQHYQGAISQNVI